MKHTLHRHPCSQDGCTETLPCDGTLELNPDGVPTVTCATYHLNDGTTAEAFCWRHDNAAHEEADPEAWAGGFARNH